MREKDGRRKRNGERESGREDETKSEQNERTSLEVRSSRRTGGRMRMSVEDGGERGGEIAAAREEARKGRDATFSSVRRSQNR